MKTQTPEGHASELKQTWDVMPTEAWANHHKWDDIARTKIGAAEYGYSQMEAQAAMHQKYGDGIRDSLENQMAGQVGSGLQYGGVDNAGAQRTQSTLGKQASERQKANFFGFGDNVGAYEQWKDQGMVLDKAQAEHLRQEGMWGVEAGMKIEERSFGLLSDSDGNLHVANLKASETDGTATKTFENGRLIERGTTSTGIQFERVTGQGGHITQESAQGTFNFGGRSLRGKLDDTGGAYSFEGVDTASGQTVRMQGSASDIDLATGSINNWQAYHETGDKGSYDKLIMSKDEALEKFSALEGSEFYKGIQGMSDGQAANVNVARDSATGRIATITADQGGRAATFDHRSSLTGSRDTHEALKVVETGLRETTGNVVIDNDVNIKRIGRGPEYIGSMTYAIQSGDSSFVKPIGQAKDHDTRNAAISAFAEKAAADTAKWVDVSGGDIEKYLKQERGKFSGDAVKALSNVWGLGYEKVGGSDKSLSFEVKAQALNYIYKDSAWQSGVRAMKEGYEWGSKDWNNYVANEMKTMQKGIIDKGRAYSGESGNSALGVTGR